METLTWCDLPVNQLQWKRTQACKLVGLPPHTVPSLKDIALVRLAISPLEITPFKQLRDTGKLLLEGNDCNTFSTIVLIQCDLRSLIDELRNKRLTFEKGTQVLTNALQQNIHMLP